MNRWIVGFCAGLLTLLAVGPSPVQGGPIIFDNGGPLTGDGDDVVSDVDFPSQAYDDFTLQTGASTIADVHWYGVYAFGQTPGTDDFTIRIYADAGGTPGGLLFTRHVGSVMRMDTGIDQDDGHDIFAFWADIDPIALAAGVTYWLSIQNDTTSDPDDNWFWSFSARPGNAVVDAFGERIELDAELAFQLTGPVPEPSTLALCGLIGAGLAGYGWRRRKVIVA